MTHRGFQDQREFQAWNDAMALKYDVERFHAHPSRLVRYVEQKRIRRIFALLAPQPDDRVLEVGCGAGHLLARVSSRQRFGVDLASALLAKAARRLGGQRGLVQSDAQRLPFRDGSWDKVYCSEVLEHIPAPATALEEMARILRDRGVAVVSVPNERLINVLKRLFRATRLDRWLLRSGPAEYSMPDRMDDEWHLHAFDLSMLLGMIPATLRVVRVEGVPFRWVPLRWVVRCERVGVG